MRIPVGAILDVLAALKPTEERRALLSSGPLSHTRVSSGRLRLLELTSVCATFDEFLMLVLVLVLVPVLVFVLVLDLVPALAFDPTFDLALFSCACTTMRPSVLVLVLALVLVLVLILVLVLVLELVLASSAG